MSPSNIGNRRVAFYGGSFDPPHLGHLAVARAAQEALDLDMVLFAPVGSQPLKPSGATASFQDRVEMIRLAIEGEPAFKLCLADAPRAGGRPNYTLETLIAVKGEFSGGVQLYCLLGADAFAGLQQWFRASEIPFVAPLIVAARPGERLDSLTSLLPLGLHLDMPGAAAHDSQQRGNAAVELRTFSIGDQSGRRAPFYLLPNVDVPISATQIRMAFRSDGGFDAQADSSRFEKLVPATVAEFIRLRRLYE
jgi:nicotinate (nicotinamide) nucleotide adenylyltransferase